MGRGIKDRIYACCLWSHTDGTGLRSQATVPEYHFLQCSGRVQDIAELVKQLRKLREGHDHTVGSMD